MPSAEIGYCGYSHLVRNYSAVTGAVLATRMSILRELGGFDESLAVDYNDVDFCLRAGSRSLRVVYTPFCKLYHFEGATVKRTTQNPTEVASFTERWRNLIERDPYFNTGLSRTNARVVPDEG
jgi:GT2 family glycosyltransferase